MTQHRRGRPLAEILDDPLLLRFGSDRYRALTNPHLIEALRRDVMDEVRAGTASLPPAQRADASPSSNDLP